MSGSSRCSYEFKQSYLSIFQDLYTQGSPETTGNFAQYSYMLTHLVEPELNLVTKHLQGLFEPVLGENYRVLQVEKEKKYRDYLLSVLDQENSEIQKSYNPKKQKV